MNEDAQPSISLCMIVKNEETFLERCLESARKAVDEIVIVDTGSSDGTVDIARRFNARLFEHSWKEDFSEARNVSLAHATSDWILFLDADEILDARSAESMKDILSHTAHFGFFFCIINMKENGVVSGRHFTVRLFRNFEGVRFTGKIHEQVIPMGTRAYAGMKLYHSGYDLKPEIMKRKKERNARILEQALALNREDAGVRYHLANTYRLLGDHERAITHAVKGLELTEIEKEAGSLYITILQVLAEVYVQMKEWDEAEACCLKALEIRDDFIDALYTLSRIYRVKKDYKKCILISHAFLEKKKLIDSDPERGFFFRSLTSWGREGEIHNDLGGLFYENGNLDRAIEEAKKAIAHSPGIARAHHNLGVALAGKGLLRKAKECFEKALEIQPCYPDAERALQSIGAAP